MSGRFVEVVLPLPLGHPYTYSVPPTMADRVTPGARVVVPLRRRELVGVVTAAGDTAPADFEPRDVLGAPDTEPALTPALLETARWMAGYYGAPLGLAMKAMLPGGMWGSSSVVVRAGDGSRVPGGLAGRIVRRLEARGGAVSVAALGRHFRQPVWAAVDRLQRVGAVTTEVVPPSPKPAGRPERILVLDDERLTLVELAEVFRRSPRQRQLYETVGQLGGRAPVAHLRERLGVSDAVVRGLVARGVARVEQVRRIRDPFADLAVSPPPATLTVAQTRAVALIDAVEPGGGALLFGVTGSGKTLVYLEAIRRQVAAGHGAIILVPEIGLTPQTVSRVRGVFGDQVAVLHSGLSDAERVDAWYSLRRGRCRVAVGARSAVFAPVRDLVAIVIDEEHEASYKNGETPRYHARDVARVRARLEGMTDEGGGGERGRVGVGVGSGGARVILGSATPSLESWAEVGHRLVRVALPERVAGQPLPPVELVDLRSAGRVAETGPVPWSVALDEAVSRVLVRGEQALLLLNRRGYASFLQCPDCGHVITCERCSISLTVHQTPSRLRCHYCDHEEPVPRACDRCGAGIQRMRGVGTQQLEQFLAGRFPEARIARMDLDTTSTKWSHHRILDRVARREVDLLVGTQMIAKGLDFPNVTLVGVVDADTALYLPDFRSAERTFQLVAQVAGRAGRGPRGGRVVVQTYNPEHYALTHAAAHDTEGFLEQEMALRRAPPYPPHVSLVNLLVTAPGEDAAGSECARLADWCAALVADRDLPISVLGPAPAPLAKVKDRWRWHVVLKGARSEIGRVVRYAAARLPVGGAGPVRITIDRDPVSLL